MGNNIRFGPSGNSDEFYEQGYKHTWEAMKWLHELGLDAFEYSFGRSVNLKRQTGEKIHDEALKYGIAMSVHAPYYINLAAEAREAKEKNLMYVRKAAAGAQSLGAKRMVIHPGVPGSDRKASLEVILEALNDCVHMLEEEGFDITLCPETMGRVSQMGSLSEVIALCSANEKLIPAIDFGHLHARSLGGLQTMRDFENILEEMENALGWDRLSNMHCHFSKIEFSASGEKKHVRFEDPGYGPDYLPLLRLFADRKLTPVVICESRGTMARDAFSMKTAYEDYIKEKGKNERKN